MAGDSVDRSDQSDSTPARQQETRPLDLIYEVLNSREMTNNVMRLVCVVSICLVIPLVVAAVVLAAHDHEFAAFASMSTAGAALLSSGISVYVGRRRNKRPRDGGGTPPSEGSG